MRELEFRRSLAGRLNGQSVDSYVSYCQRVERELAVDLDACDLSPQGIRDLAERLRGAGVIEKTVGNCRSALQAYAVMGSRFVIRPDGRGRREEATRFPDSYSDGLPQGGVAVPSPLLHATVRELLSTYSGVMDELRKRGVVRTENSPFGDYAEFLFSKAFDWTLNGNSAAGHDAVDPDGVRYQIKGRRLAASSRSRQLSAIRRIEDRTFDYLAAVLFDPGFGVHRAAVVPHALVQARARRSDHTNSWIFHLDDRVWSETGVRDVSDELAAAAIRL